MTEFSAELVAADGSRLALSGEQRVGRSADCDITIDDPRVSRGHAMLRVKDDSLTVEDLGSANGTQVNGRPTSGETALRDGDTLSFDRHAFVVALSGGDIDLEATMVGSIGDDATVVSAPPEPEPQPEHEPAPEPGPEPEPQPEPEPEPAPAPAESVAAEPPPEPVSEAKPEPSPSSPPSDLPGSWIDSGTSEGTRVLSLDALAESESERLTAERVSDLPHLILMLETGQAGEALELQPGDGSEPDVWEIGRDPNCQIAIAEPSVSARHAQLIHQGGRWKLVNLVSANGIFVNGEKRLTAYLADGDEIRLGVATVVFRAAADAGAAHAAATAPPRTSTPPVGDTAGKSKRLGKGIVIAGAAAAVLVVAVAAYFLLG